MVGTVTSDYVDGHSYEDVLAGFEITRTFRVVDLVDAPERQLIEAVTSPGIPLLNEVYPGTVGILAVRRNVRPDGPNAARVAVTYSANTNRSTFNQPVPVSNDGQDVKQISAGTREFLTPLDSTGSPMILTAPPMEDGWPAYLSEARIFIPAGEIVFERIETSPAVSRARQFVGRLNNALIGGYAERTLLFVDLTAQSDDGGRIWNCTYTFRYDAGGWKHKDHYHGPDGKIPEDAVEVTWDVLPTANFSSLDLDFGDSQTPIT